MSSDEAPKHERVTLAPLDPEDALRALLHVRPEPDEAGATDSLPPVVSTGRSVEREGASLSPAMLSHSP